MDIVAYSQLHMDRQHQVLRELQDAVRNTSEFARAQAADQLIRLPTGDGMALVFFGDPEAPVRCAIELTKVLRDHPEIKLRMGIHTGPVYRVADINANRNVAGGGINIAQRVMDCGDAGHILFSKAAADVLDQLSTWKTSLRDLGEAKVKHGLRIRLFNFCDSEAGNRKLPSKIGPKPFLKRIAAVAIPALVAAVMMLGVYRNFFEHRHQPFQLPMRRLTSTEKSRLAACSPDGKYLVHVVQEGDSQSLSLVDVGNESERQLVAPDEGGYRGLVFSADSQDVYYSKSIGGSGALYQVPIVGGSPRKLIRNVSSPIDLSWDGKQFAFLRPAGDETTLFVAAAILDGNERSVSKGRFFGGPAWSPDGKTIALLKGKGGSPIADLIEVPASGGRETLISREDWSYNGRIAWLRNGSGLVLQAGDPAFNTQLWLVSYPGGSKQRITNDLAKYESVTVTADAKVLTAIRTDHVSTIWVATPGGEARQITFDGPKRQGGSVVWTPDDQILYTSVDTNNTVNIWVMRADGRDRRELTSSSRNNFYPAVAKDGQTVVFVSNRTGGANIWKMDIDGGHQTQLTHGDADYRPQLSPDGNWLLYTHSSAHSNMGKLLRMGVNGNDPTLLSADVWLNDLSPDGKLLILQAKDGSAIVPFAGGEPRRFVNVPKTHTYLPEGSPPVLWSPDGSALTYVETSNGVSNIWSQPLSHGQPHGPAQQLTKFASDLIFWFAWSHDGRQLAICRGSVRSDVVLLSD